MAGRILGARGEATIEMPDGTEQRLLYTNRALIEAERELGKSILGIAEGFTTGTSGMSETLVLLKVGMEAARHEAREGGRRISDNGAVRVMDLVGFAGVVGPVMEGVADVLSYEPASSENEEVDPNA